MVLKIAAKIRKIFDIRKYFVRKIYFSRNFILQLSYSSLNLVLQEVYLSHYFFCALSRKYFEQKIVPPRKFHLLVHE